MKNTTVNLSNEFLAGYQAGRTGAGLRDERPYARLWLSGPDRIVFLQRLTTNDVRLSPGQGTVTVLTSPTARIVVVFTVLAFHDGLLLLAGPDQGPTAYTALRSQIFFGDNVQIAGRGEALAQFSLYGPRAGLTLATAIGSAQAGPNFDLSRLPLFGWQNLPLVDVDVTLQRNEGLGDEGFTLLAPSAAGDAVQDALLAAGAVLMPNDAYHALRVEFGAPAQGFELTDQVSPLEAGLRRFCNDHKGCYTGQEIIARQITYDKVSTRLVGLLPEAPVSEGDEVKAGSRRIGKVSSAVFSPALERSIALAFVRRPHDEPGTVVSISNGEQEIPGQVASLPFAPNVM